jgi:alpha-1,6-mannosyltransferase
VLFRRAVMGGPLASLRIDAVTLLAATTLLDHAMTGLFTLIGLVLIALAAPRGQHRRAFLCVALIAAGVAALCPLWPWYRFIAALGSRSNNEYWFNKYILFMMLTRWAWPAYLCGITALLVPRPLVPTFLLGAMLCLALALVSLVVRSPVLARLPMPAMLFLHLPIALFCHDSGLLHPLTWPARLRALVAGDDWDRYPSVAETMVAIVLASCAIPQLMEVASAPALARPYLAPLLSKPTKLVRLRAPMDRLLARIGERDVVLSDLVTSWRIPSSRGRIVAAQHYEFFVPDQARREAELDRFFSPGASARDRLALIRKYHVRWIVLNSDALPRPVQDELMVPEAVVARSGGLALLDADVWARQMVLRPPDSTGRSRRAAS